ncbi:hypothetical protein N7486_001863 [Penicillium sp. IBT 16267x]|nr:hypothetical protein N7486_001863 [Penicillium sp. IBT 16267x]
MERYSALHGKAPGKSYILSPSYKDDVFASEHIKCPRDIWRLTLIPGHRLSTLIHFKQSMKEVPILRTSRNKGGLFMTDP